MSQENALEFVTKASQDPNLYQSVIGEVTEQHGAVDIADPGDHHLETATSIARLHGYDFTPDELRQALTQFTGDGAQSSGRQLSDAELDLVAGGMSDSYTVSSSGPSRK